MRILFALVLAGLVAACAGPDRPKPTPLSNLAPQRAVKRVWSRPMAPVQAPLELRVLGGRVYLASANGVVAALDAQSGNELWRATLDTPLSAGVGTDGRYSAVVSRNNDVLVLDGDRLLWQQKLKALTLTAPLVAGGRVFTLSTDRSVSAFDAATGQRLWTQQRPGDALVLGQAGLLTAVGDTLVVGFGAKVAGLNPQNGSTRWETAVVSARGTNEVERLVDVVAGGSRNGSQLCVRAFQYAVACLDAANGRLLWTKPANGASGVAGDDGLVVGADADGRLHAWNRKEGDKRWSDESLRFRGLTAPLVAGSTVIVADEQGYVHFLAKDSGALLNRVLTDESGVSAAPVLAGQTLLVVSRRGTVYAYRPD